MSKKDSSTSIFNFLIKFILIGLLISAFLLLAYADSKSVAIEKIWGHFSLMSLWILTLSKIKNGK